MLFEAPHGSVPDGHIRVLERPVCQLLRTRRLCIMPSFGGSYRSSFPGAQPPPVQPVEVLIDDELGRPLQPFFSLAVERAEAKTSHPSPLNAVPRSSVAVCKRCAHLPCGGYWSASRPTSENHPPAKVREVSVPSVVLYDPGLTQQ